MVRIVLQKSQAGVDRVREADIVVRDHGHVWRRDGARYGRHFLVRAGRRLELPPFDQPPTNPPQFGIGLFARVRHDDAVLELRST